MKRLALLAALAAAALGIAVSTASAWPSTTGTLDGNATEANGLVTLTSDAVAPYYGAFDFDVPSGTTFSTLDTTFDFSVVSGAIGAGSPRLSVGLANGDTWFVYAYDVAPGKRYENGSANGGVYVSRDDAMAAAGDQAVDSASLVVDNGDLSISIEGLTVDPTCMPTGFVRDGVDLTAARIGGDVTGPVDATGCNIGVYYGPDSERKRSPTRRSTARTTTASSSTEQPPT